MKHLSSNLHDLLYGGMAGWQMEGRALNEGWKV